MALVVSISDFNETEWENISHLCTYATYFNTPQWFSIFNGITGKFIFAGKKILFDDAIMVYFPIVNEIKLIGLISTAYSSLNGTYGGWLSEKVLDTTHISFLIKLLNKNSNYVLRENPYNPDMQNISTAEERDDVTHVIDLREPEIVLHARLSGGHQRAIRTAQREGLQVKEAQTVDDWQAYYSVYKNTVERWKSIGENRQAKFVYPWLLFQRIYHNKTDHEKLWIVTHNDQIIAGMLCFYWNKHCAAWHGGARTEYLQMRPNHFLIWETIIHAQKNGYHWFDFNPSGGFESVSSYKDHFGTIKKKARLFEKKTILKTTLKSTADLLLHVKNVQLPINGKIVL